MKTYLSKLKLCSFLFVVLIFIFPALGYPEEEEIAKYPSRPITYIHPYPRQYGGFGSAYDH